MTIWFILVLAVLVVLALIIPMLRAGDGDENRRDAALAVYRGQLKDIAADAHLPEDEAEAAKREVERRLIKAGGQSDVTLAARTPKAVAALLGLLAIGGAFGLYLGNGKPGEADQPAPPPEIVVADAAAEGAKQNPQLASMLPILESKLKERPNDAAGLVIYARALVTLGRYPQALEVWDRLIAQDPKNEDYRIARARVLSDLGRHDDALQAWNALIRMDPKNSDYRVGRAQTIMIASNGLTPAADLALREAETIEPRNPAPAYFRGVAAMEAGDLDRASELFRGLLAAAPEGAPWAEDVGQRLQQVEAARMAPEDRQQMIETMVAQLAERLKADPSDVDGWRRLGRAYAVLGRKAEAVDALENALKAAPASDRAAIQLDLDTLKGQN